MGATRKSLRPSGTVGSELMGASLRCALTIRAVQTDPSSAANAVFRRAAVVVPLATTASPKKAGVVAASGFAAVRTASLPKKAVRVNSTQWAKQPGLRHTV